MANKPGYDECQLIPFIFEKLKDGFYGPRQNADRRSMEADLERGNASLFGKFVEKEISGREGIKLRTK